MLSAQPKVGAETLIVLEITKTESNNCFIIHCFDENKDKNSITCTLVPYEQPGYIFDL